MPLTDLDFQRAEFGGSAAASPHCTWCMRGLECQCFHAAGSPICEVCAARARELSPGDTAATFWRSVALGALAATMGGLVFFALFRLTQGTWMIFGSIGIGYLTGKAMRIGSHGVTGRRYRIASAVLTYLAITVSTMAVISGGGTTWWVYPLLSLAPFFMLFLGKFGMALLILLFAFTGMRWAWGQLAGSTLRITGPHPVPE